MQLAFASRTVPPIASSLAQPDRQGPQRPTLAEHRSLREVTLPRAVDVPQLLFYRIDGVRWPTRHSSRVSRSRAAVVKGVCAPSIQKLRDSSSSTDTDLSLDSGEDGPASQSWCRSTYVASKGGVGVGVGVGVNAGARECEVDCSTSAVLSFAEVGFHLPASRFSFCLPRRAEKDRQTMSRPASRTRPRLQLTACW